VVALFSRLFNPKKGAFHMEATRKQMSVLWRCTGRKFWEVVTPPTVGEASGMLDLLMPAIKAKGEERLALAMKAAVAVRRWFPDFKVEEVHWRGGSKKKHATKGNAGGEAGDNGGDDMPDNDAAQPPPEAAKPEAPRKAPERTPAPAQPELPPAEAESKPDPAPERKPAPKVEPKAQPPPEPKPAKPEAKPEAKKPAAVATPGSTAATLHALLAAGVRNVWLYGPAGCGKTTLCKLAAEAMGLPCIVLSCSAGTSPAEVTGFKYPEPRHSAVSAALDKPGIIVLDEAPMLDASVAAVANAMLANDSLLTPLGTITRHPECYIIATANTMGEGANRQYCGNNQLDGATLDRFAGAFLPVDYDREYERQYDAEVCQYVWRLRDAIATHKLRRIASTRSIITGDKLKAAGLDWRAMLVATWTPDERRLAGLAA